MTQYQFKVFNPQSAATKEDVESINAIYKVWKKTFSEVLEAKSGQIDPDDFFRQQVLFCLYENEQIIGFNLATKFDFAIENHLDHHFIRGLSTEAVQTMQQKDIQTVLTLEYSTVMPEWRKHQSNIPWAEVLISMALLYNDHYHLADAVIGTPRTDIKMDRVGANVGYFTIKDTIYKMDYPCSVVAETIKNKRTFNNLLTHKMAHQLWHERYEAGTQQTKQNKTLKAA